MKKLLVALTLFSVITAGAMAYGHGMGGWGGCDMGPGYGCQMMGYGHMGPMMGGYGYGYDQKFLDETADLRKQLHEKRFEYFEALRDPKTTPQTVATIEKEIREIQEKIYEKSPRTGFRGPGGYGHCW